MEGEKVRLGFNTEILSKPPQVLPFQLDGQDYYYLPDAVAIVSQDRIRKGRSPLSESTVRSRWIRKRKMPPPRRHEGYSVFAATDMDNLRILAMDRDEIGSAAGISRKTVTNRMSRLRKRFPKDMEVALRKRLLAGEK